LSFACPCAADVLGDRRYRIGLILIGAAGGIAQHSGQGHGCDRSELPNLVIVVAHGAVRGEAPALRGVQYAQPGPGFAVAIGRRHTPLGVHVASEVRCHHPRVKGARDVPDDLVESSWLELIEVSAGQQVHYLRQLGIRLDDGCGIIVRPAGLHLRRSEPEQEEVLVTCRLADLDVGAVQGADGDGPIHHELHVPCARAISPGPRAAGCGSCSPWCGW